MQLTRSQPNSSPRRHGTKVAVLTFSFFLIKGLLWLAAPLWLLSRT